MFQLLRSTLRTGRKMVFPLGRTATLLLVWTNRHTVALWFRSIKNEIEGFGVDRRRLTRLIRALWAVSSDHRTANTDALRSVSVRDDGFGVEARAGWVGRATVEALLAPTDSPPPSASVA